MATTQAKHMGMKSFKAGSKGAKLRGKIAEHMAKGKSGLGFHRKG